MYVGLLRVGDLLEAFKGSGQEGECVPLTEVKFEGLVDLVLAVFADLLFLQGLLVLLLLPDRLLAVQLGHLVLLFNELDLLVRLCLDHLEHVLSSDLIHLLLVLLVELVVLYDVHLLGGNRRYGHLLVQISRQLGPEKHSSNLPFPAAP